MWITLLFPLPPPHDVPPMRLLRDLLGALQELVQALRTVAERLQVDQLEQLEPRVQALETSRALFEGEVAGALLKVESRFNAARAAEERVRVKTRKRGDEDEEADLGVDAEAAASELARAYAQRGAGAQLQSVPQAVAPDARASIRARKWRGA